MTADEDVSIGEGFAFFRWHCLRFKHLNCPGINGGYGSDPECVCLWRTMRHE